MDSLRALWRTGCGAREGKALMGLRPNVLPRLPGSLWAATAPSAPSCPALEGEQTAELCVIGGGFTGLSTALHTAESGADVLSVQKLAGHASTQTTLRYDRRDAKAKRKAVELLNVPYTAPDCK